MKILLLDIETAPHKAYTWGLFKQTINIDRIVEAGYTLCWSAKWLGKSKIMQSRHTDDGFLLDMWELLNEADVVVTYNGTSFDLPTLNREFVNYGLTPPAPYKQVDMLKVVRKHFRFASNKLDYVSQALGLGSKVKHKGFELWRECMNGDEKAFRDMLRYNKGDVKLLEDLYNYLLGWIDNHPDRRVYSKGCQEGLICSNCGSKDVHVWGTTIARVRKYERIHCGSCGAWSRGALIK